MYSPITRKIDLPGDDVQSITLHIQLQTNRDDPSERRPNSNRSGPPGGSSQAYNPPAGNRSRNGRRSPILIVEPRHPPDERYRRGPRQNTGPPTPQYQEEEILYASPEQSPHRSPRPPPQPPPRQPSRSSSSLSGTPSPKPAADLPAMPWELKLLNGLLSGSTKTPLPEQGKQGKGFVRRNPAKEEWTQPRVEIVQEVVRTDRRNRQWTKQRRRTTIVESD